MASATASGSHDRALRSSSEAACTARTPPSSLARRLRRVSPNPGMMAAAFKKGVEAGREAFLAGLGKQRKFAEASSPLTGFLRDEK